MKTPKYFSYNIDCNWNQFKDKTQPSIIFWNKSNNIVVQSLSCVQIFAIPQTAASQAPCPSPSPRVCLNSCQLNWWCYLTISSSATPFTFCFQSFPASGSFPRSRLFTSVGQSPGTSASVCPSNEDWFSLRLSGFILLLFKGPSRVFSSTTVWNHQFFGIQSSLWSSSHIHT